MASRLLRLLTVAIAVLALALPAAGIAATADVTTDRGIVQSVSVGSGQIVLAALDGSIVSFAVTPTTRVRLNGIRVPLSDIRPGFVATVTHDGSSPAVLVRAFGRPASVTDRGVVTVLTKSSITLRTIGGATVTVSLDTGTRFRFLGLPARRFLARPGALVTVTHTGDAPAKAVNVLKRAGA